MEKITKDHSLSGSQDILADNIQKLKEIFPEVFSEGHVDFEKLQLLLGNLITPKDDLYGLNWWGKSEAIKESMKRSLGTLRPHKESSKNWDTTENLYIEGDNLEVLKLLQKSYSNKIKMIYIDPPYNTGKDFVYKDNYKDNLKNYLAQTGQVDSEGIKQSTNTKDDGRYHSNWLNMMYPRLKLARNLLTEDGVIFISIDDNEIHNLREICDEIFGEKNFIETLKWKRKKQPSFLAKHIAKVMEYILIYSKNSEKLEKLSVEGTSDLTKKVVNLTNPYSERLFKSGVRVKAGQNGIIPKGKFQIKSMTIEYLDDVNFENGITTNPIKVKAQFSVSQSKIEEFIDKKLLFITVNFGLRRDVGVDEIGKRKSITDLILDWGDNQDSDQEIKDLFGEVKLFDYTKPSKLIKKLVKSVDSSEKIILDFFAGSGTTAQSIIELNSEDGGNRKFICVQIPEEISNNPAYEFMKSINKPTNLCEIGKERIRRASDKIKGDKKEELKQLKEKSSLIQTDEEKTKLEELEQVVEKLDIGFKVFKLDSSNIEAWDTEMPSTADEIKVQLEFSRNHLHKGRTEEDLLFELLLKQGQLLTSPIEEREITGAKVYSVNYGELFICMNAPISMAVIEGIGAWGRESIEEAIVDLKPVLVLKDEAFGKDDAFKTNAELRLKNEFGFAKVNTL